MLSPYDSTPSPVGSSHGYPWLWIDVKRLVTRKLTFELLPRSCEMLRFIASHDGPLSEPGASKVCVYGSGPGPPSYVCVPVSGVQNGPLPPAGLQCGSGNSAGSPYGLPDW